MRLRQLHEAVHLRSDPEMSAHFLHTDGPESDPAGVIKFGYPGAMEQMAAQEFFPEVVGPQDKVARIRGIDLAAAKRGQGLGQMLYLHGLANGGADWYYNSQTEPPATNALKALASKGLIELYWSPREPGWDERGRTHLVRITPAGRKALAAFAAKQV